jgi:hypothetical protein
MKNHDVRALIFGMGREVTISRRIRILFTTTTNRHDLQRAERFIRTSHGEVQVKGVVLG